MHLALLKSYQFATTFNFSSASVVDMAIKCDGSRYGEAPVKHRYCPSGCTIERY